MSPRARRRPGHRLWVHGSPNGKKEATPGSGTVPAATSGPIRLQARLDRSRPEYREGEWVALRFLASQPAHLRVYRVDASGHVTRLFSTYDAADSSSPAR